MVLLSQVTDPLTLLAPIHGGKKDRLYCVCRLARFEPAHPVVRQCPKLFPPLIPSDIMPSSSYGESVTQTKNGGILKMPVSVTIELVKRASEKMADVLEVDRGPTRRYQHSALVLPLQLFFTGWRR